VLALTTPTLLILPKADESDEELTVLKLSLIAQFIGAMLVQYIPNIFSLAKHWKYIGPILHQ